jgi:hypothetical protein
MQLHAEVSAVIDVDPRKQRMTLARTPYFTENVTTLYLPDETTGNQTTHFFTPRKCFLVDGLRPKIVKGSLKQ